MFKYIIVLLLSNSIALSQTDMDSIFDNIDSINIKEQFRVETFDLKFNKGTKILAYKSNNLLDSIFRLTKIYKGCYCEVYTEHYSKLKTKRIKKIEELIRLEIDTTVFKIKLYYNTNPYQINNIYGSSKTYLNHTKDIVFVNVNCNKSFHIMNNPKPYTGYHSHKTYGNETILSYYEKGKITGKSFIFNRDGKIRIVHQYKNGNFIGTTTKHK